MPPAPVAAVAAVVAVGKADRVVKVGKADRVVKVGRAVKAVKAEVLAGTLLDPLQRRLRPPRPRSMMTHARSVAVDVGGLTVEVANKVATSCACTARRTPRTSLLSRAAP